MACFRYCSGNKTNGWQGSVYLGYATLDGFHCMLDGEVFEAEQVDLGIGPRLEFVLG